MHNTTVGARISSLDKVKIEKLVKEGHFFNSSDFVRAAVREKFARARAVMESKSVHNPGHKLKVALVAQLHAEGCGEDQIVQVFSHMEDFNEFKTRKQVQQALAKGYRPFRCEKIENLCGCLKGSCRIYQRQEGLNLRRFMAPQGMSEDYMQALHPADAQGA